MFVCIFTAKAETICERQTSNLFGMVSEKFITFLSNLIRKVEWEINDSISYSRCHQQKII